MIKMSLQENDSALVSIDSGPAETTRHRYMAHIRPWKCRAIVPVNQALNWLSQELVQISQLERSQLFLLQKAVVYTDSMGRHGNHSVKSYKAAHYLSSTKTSVL